MYTKRDLVLGKTNYSILFNSIILCNCKVHGISDTARYLIIMLRKFKIMAKIITFLKNYTKLESIDHIEQYYLKVGTNIETAATAVSYTSNPQFPTKS